MPYVEKQRHGKHEYYYLVKSVRLSPSKFSKIRVFLGREVPSHEKLQAFFKELDAKAPKHYVPRWLSKEAVERLEDLRAAAQAFKEFPSETLPKDFLVRFTYNTNAIEGNPLTLRQTALILAEGIAPQGARTDDVVEVMNAKDAWDFVKGYKGAPNKAFLLRVQYEVTKNTSCRLQGRFRDSQVGITGSKWKPPAAAEVPKKAAKFLADYKKLKRSLHPVELASWLHNRVAQVHPFTDGNGRTARLLMNWVLMRNRFPPAVVNVSNKEEYYGVIEAADKGDEKPAADFLASQLIKQYSKQAER